MSSSPLWLLLTHWYSLREAICKHNTEYWGARLCFPNTPNIKYYSISDIISLVNKISHRLWNVEHEFYNPTSRNIICSNLKYNADHLMFEVLLLILVHWKFILKYWWWTEKPGVLQSMGSQRVRHDWATELNWLIFLNN